MNFKEMVLRNVGIYNLTEELLEGIPFDMVKEKFLKGNFINYGFAEFGIDKNSIHVEYTGKMGDSKEDVIKCMKKVFGFSFFNKAKPYEEKGRPSYLYTASWKIIK